jgi:DNA-binding NarL/FixJ family response regulator
VTAFWVILLSISIVGITRLKSVGFIVDDLPKNNAIYTDLKYFEKNFHGVMPLEIMIDTKKKNGATTLPTLQKIDELHPDIVILDIEMPEMDGITTIYHAKVIYPSTEFLVFTVFEEDEKIFASHVVSIEFRYDNFYLTLKSNKVKMIQLDLIKEGERTIFKSKFIHWALRNNLQFTKEAKEKLEIA